MNVPPLLGAVISSGKATMGECSTILNLEDLYDILEVVQVDAHNQHILNKRNPEE